MCDEASSLVCPVLDLAGIGQNAEVDRGDTRSLTIWLASTLKSNKVEEEVVVANQSHASDESDPWLRIMFCPTTQVDQSASHI